MNPWSTLNIGIVYYGALAASFTIGVLSLLYLNPIRSVKSITDKSGALWHSTLITTVLLAGLLGAMSVTLKDCYGGYEKYLNPQCVTIDFSLEMVSTACLSFMILFGVWFLILITFSMLRTWNTNVGSFYKLISVAFIISGILGFYLVLFVNKN